MKEEVPFVLRLRKLFVLIRQALFLALATTIGLVFYASYNIQNTDSGDIENEQVVEEFNEDDWDKIENGIHVRTGLVDAEGLMTVVGNCTSCHSAKLLTQNRMSAERWDETIKWMQETQNLWDFGKNKEIIINYLTTNYPYKAKGRRAILSNIEWYELED